MAAAEPVVWVWGLDARGWPRVIQLTVEGAGPRVLFLDRDALARGIPHSSNWAAFGVQGTFRKPFVRRDRARDTREAASSALAEDVRGWIGELNAEIRSRVLRRKRFRTWLTKWEKPVSSS